MMLENIGGSAGYANRRATYIEPSFTQLMRVSSTPGWA
jgi:hypothetical protein